MSLINEQIKSTTVRLVGEEDNPNFVILTKDAIKKAYDRGLDLVVLNDKQNPPTCKILDANKYFYELKQKSKQAKTPDLKEMTLTPNIATNDLLVKIKKIKEFLVKKHPVQIRLVFKGRENKFSNNGFELLNTITESLLDVGMVESEPKKVGNAIILKLKTRK